MVELHMNSILLMIGDMAEISTQRNITNNNQTFTRPILNLQIYGEKDSDGYFYGEINGRVGYVPHKMVSELPMDEEVANRHLWNETVPPRHHHSGKNAMSISCKKLSINFNKMHNYKL
ncbi:RIMS-binding protein 2 [Caerostris darwini]|uniref:RIMS-binding protein 2 n=1 Tax=Caerostris darwini TaxID=1538125 RepID=A0AAV4WGX1_9ARAC|nr:RIMS-binding protein 2 [Caerostris darwini]